VLERIGVVWERGRMGGGGGGGGFGWGGERAGRGGRGMRERVRRRAGGCEVIQGIGLLVGWVEGFRGD